MTEFPLWPGHHVEQFTSSSSSSGQFAKHRLKSHF